MAFGTGVRQPTPFWPTNVRLSHTGPFLPPPFCTSSWLRERSGTFWHRSSPPRKVGWVAWAPPPAPRASQRWAATRRDWLRTTSSAGSEGPPPVYPPPPLNLPPLPRPSNRHQPRLTDRHEQTDVCTETNDGRIQESNTRTQRCKEWGSNTWQPGRRKKLALKVAERSVNWKKKMKTNFKKKETKRKKERN